MSKPVEGQEPGAPIVGDEVVRQPVQLMPGESSAGMSMSGYPLRFGKTRGMSDTDVSLRAQKWVHDCKGYFKYGTPTVPTDGDAQEKAWDNWFPRAREIAVRENVSASLLPSSLTLTALLRHIQNTHFRVTVDVGILYSLMSLSNQDTAFSAITQHLPRVAGRLRSCWSRLNTVQVPPSLVVQELAHIPLQMIPNTVAPLMRWYGDGTELASASGGPPLFAGTDATNILDAFQSYNEVNAIVTWLEAGEYWLRNGAASILTDFRAYQDMLNQISKGSLAGTFQSGLLPDISSLSPVAADPVMLTDMLCRCLFWKFDVDQGTDKWGVWPTPLRPKNQGLVPILTMGPRTLWDEISIGAPKFGIMDDDPTQFVDDVNVDLWFDGSDMPELPYMYTARSTDARNIFNNDTAWMAKGSPTVTAVGSTIDWALDTAIVGFLEGKNVIRNHVMERIMASIAGSGTPETWIDEADGVSVSYANYLDILNASGLAIAGQMKIPLLFKSAVAP